MRRGNRPNFFSNVLRFPDYSIIITIFQFCWIFYLHNCSDLRPILAVLSYQFHNLLILIFCQPFKVKFLGWQSSYLSQSVFEKWDWNPQSKDWKELFTHTFEMAILFFCPIDKVLIISWGPTFFIWYRTGQDFIFLIMHTWICWCWKLLLFLHLRLCFECQAVRFDILRTLVFFDRPNVSIFVAITVKPFHGWRDGKRDLVKW